MAGATSDGSATTVARSDHQHGGTISFPLGTVSAPSIAPSGDSNTGLWSPAADTLAFSVAGGEAMRIVTKPSYKSVGINAPNPSWPLQIASPIDGNVCEFDGPGGGFFYANYANSTQYFLGFAGGSTPSTALAFGTQSAIPFYILSNNTGRVTITSGGNVGIGTWFNPSYQLELTANSAAKPTSSSWTISSDARIKTVIDDWRRGLAAIMQLQPKVYRLNGQYGSVDDGKNHISVIAQEAIEVMPEMIGSYQWQATREVQETMPDGQTTTRIEPDPTVEPVELYNLDTNALQWTLVNAIKELAGQVEALTARIAILEAQT
jgi:hypothetical protein